MPFFFFFYVENFQVIALDAEHLIYKLLKAVKILMRKKGEFPVGLISGKIFILFVDN